MLHPFESVGPEPTSALGADAYAAEADIMRFIAILALCLMLLFSVDQSFNREARSPNPEATPAAAATARLLDPPPSAARGVVDPSSQSPAQATTVSAPVASNDPPVTTFTDDAAAAPASSGDSSATSLYFSSDVVLLTLLTQRRIEVYLSRDAQWFAVTLTGVSAVDPPGKPLYRLRPETVPELLRRTVSARRVDRPVGLTAAWLGRLGTTQSGSIGVRGYLSPHAV